MSRRFTGSVALLSGALLLTLGGPTGCQRSAPALHVESVRVAETMLDAAAESGVDRAAVEAATRGALAEAGFRFDAGQPSYRARVEVVGLRLTAGEGGRGLQVEARVELDLTAPEDKEPARREAGHGSAAVGQGGPPAATRQALAAALGEASRGLRVGLSAEGKPTEGLLSDLGSSDVRVRDHAVQALGERGDRKAVPALVERLHDGDRRVVDHAIGALGQLKDQRAVAPLIELTRGTDAAIALRIMPVVTDLGGRDAEGWLLTLAQAHPDGRVREAATQALRDLTPGAVTAPK